MREPRIIEGCLPSDLYRQVCEFARAAPLTFGAKSNSKTDPHGHLAYQPVEQIGRHNLGDVFHLLPLVLQEAWDQFVKRFAPELGRTPLLIRCYVNAYSYGMDGYFHVDSQRPDETTVILYITDKWWPDWAGETVMMDYERKRYSAVLPAPNRAVMLPSDMLHCARAVSRKCSEPRMVVVFKFRPYRSQEFERLSRWLMGRGAYRHDHQKGSLHDHLCRVFMLLADRGESREVCFGGGLHSIYGTNAFKTRLVDTSDRARADVAGHFGRDAESIAYDFSRIDRPKTLEEIQSEVHQFGKLIDLTLSYDSVVTVTQERARQLTLIECANLVDQNALSKWPNLAKLWHGAKHDTGRTTTEKVDGVHRQPASGAGQAGNQSVR